MRIKVLGAHNTESRNTKHTSLLVDGIIALDAGGLTSSLSFKNQMKIKAILLTHAHYDHIRDVPAFAMNLYLRRKCATIYTHQAVFNNLTRYLLNGETYPEFHEKPLENPTLRVQILEPYQEFNIEGYNVLPLPVTHALPCMGYQIASSDGKTFFYTGDTGPNLSGIWKYISPQVLFIELTASNRWEESMAHSGHLTPNLLKNELISFRESKGYLPRIIAVHLNPAGESEIKSEITEIEKSLDIPIELAREGMQIQV